LSEENGKPVAEQPDSSQTEEISQRAAELCRDMLAYSGKVDFSVRSLNLSDLVRDMAQMLKASISKKAIVHYHLAPDLPAVEADAGQLRQIAMNLLVNASEAIGDRNGEITVATGTSQYSSTYLNSIPMDENLPEGNYVYLDVTDTGCGMNEATLSKIFDPFFTTKFPGRGLGLAAVQGIVRRHRGAVRVYSEPGNGTTIRILLPASDKTPGAGEPDTPGRIWRGGGTVLFADDEEYLRTLAKRMLERLGFTVVVASNGVEAVQLFREKHGQIDLVFLDLTMPEMNGEEAFQEMRRLRPDVRVLLASGYSEHEISTRFAGKGLAGFIAKPYQMATLSQTLRKIFQNDTGKSRREPPMEA
jgi:two-component system cell cycle sensor histidine kinase/response regulator CckA